MNRTPYSSRRSSAFTLIELLTVITIIALLASLLFPVINSAFYKTDILRCSANLRALGAAAHSYATDHDNLFPEIEPDPQHPLGVPTDSGNPRLPILTALKNYGIVDKTVQCPTDLKLGATSSYATKQSSYMWQPLAEDENATSITRYTRRGAFPASLARTQLATDWVAIHPVSPADGAPMRFNVLFADGHVLSADQTMRMAHH